MRSCISPLTFRSENRSGSRASTTGTESRIRSSCSRRWSNTASATSFSVPRQRSSANRNITPIDEAHPRRPINPYGKLKSLVEEVLPDFDLAHGLRYVCLRYFNAAGADPSGALGERHEPGTHLIPLILQVASGRRSHIGVYGRDYSTPDGTCIRYYIHVEDLCQAHLLPLQSLLVGAPSSAYNLGNGDGFSVQTVIEVAQRVTGRPILAVDGARRAGDPALLPTRPVPGPNSIGSRVMPIWKASSPTPGTGRRDCQCSRRSQAHSCRDSSRAAAA